MKKNKCLQTNLGKIKFNKMLYSKMKNYFTKNITVFVLRNYCYYNNSKKKKKKNFYYYYY